MTEEFEADDTENEDTDRDSDNEVIGNDGDQEVEDTEFWLHLIENSIFCTIFGLLYYVKQVTHVRLLFTRDILFLSCYLDISFFPKDCHVQLY